VQIVGWRVEGVECRVKGVGSMVSYAASCAERSQKDPFTYGKRLPKVNSFQKSIAPARQQFPKSRALHSGVSGLRVWPYSPEVWCSGPEVCRFGQPGGLVFRLGGRGP